MAPVVSGRPRDGACRSRPEDRCDPERRRRRALPSATGHDARPPAPGLHGRARLAAERRDRPAPRDRDPPARPGEASRRRARRDRQDATPAVRALARLPGVQVEADVPDLRPWLARARRFRVRDDGRDGDQEQAARSDGVRPPRRSRPRPPATGSTSATRTSCSSPTATSPSRTRPPESSPTRRSPTALASARAGTSPSTTAGRPSPGATRRCTRTWPWPQRRDSGPSRRAQTLRECARWRGTPQPLEAIVLRSGPAGRGDDEHVGEQLRRNTDPPCRLEHGRSRQVVPPGEHPQGRKPLCRR